MKKFWLMLSTISGLLLMSFGHPEVAHAQLRSGTDTIRFVGAKQGINYDGQGEAWCWVAYNTDGTGWHGYWGSALDEVAQTGPYSSTAAFSTYCPSTQGEPPQPVAPQVEFRVYAKTDSPQCTMLSPCASLWVVGRSGTYTGVPCTFIRGRPL